MEEAIRLLKKGNKANVVCCSLFYPFFRRCQEFLSLRSPCFPGLMNILDKFQLDDVPKGSH